jgi:hypothetical protein
VSERIAEEQGIDRLCLHAWKLTFRSPTAKKKTTVIAPLPPLFRKTLKALSLPSADVEK